MSFQFTTLHSSLERHGIDRQLGLTNQDTGRTEPLDHGGRSCRQRWPVVACIDHAAAGPKRSACRESPTADRARKGGSPVGPLFPDGLSSRSVRRPARAHDLSAKRRERWKQGGPRRTGGRGSLGGARRAGAQVLRCCRRQAFPMLPETPMRPSAADIASRPLVLRGMHRSGVSPTASLLGGAGVLAATGRAA
jgi:hypothetical protein